MKRLVRFFTMELALIAALTICARVSAIPATRCARFKRQAQFDGAFAGNESDTAGGALASGKWRTFNYSAIVPREWAASDAQHAWRA